jgi:hypothetical protein
VIPLAFLIGGIILEKNPQWFNGAHTVGIIATTIGVVWISVIVLTLAIVIVGKFSK